MNLGELLEQKIFLGQEFLTWLWYLQESEGGAEVKDLGWVELSLGGRLVLGPAMGADGSRVTVSGAEASLAEAREALRQGKLVESLRLGFEVHGEEYALSLEAAELTLKSLKLPTTGAPGEELDGLEGLALERVALLENAVKAVEGLLSLFLAQRLHPEQGPGLRRALGEWADQEEGQA